MHSRTLIWLAIWLAALEALTLFLVNVIAYAIREESFQLPERYLAAGLLLCIVYLLCGASRGSYAFQRTGAERIHVMRSLQCWTGTMVLFVLALYGFKLSEDFSRFWLLEMVVVGGFSLIVVRTSVLAWITRARRRGRFASRVAVIGAPEPVKEMTALLLGGVGNGVQFVGAYIGEGMENEMLQGVPRFGTQKELLSVVAKGTVDDVLLCYEPDQVEAFQSSLAAFREQPVNIRLRVPSFLREVPVLRVDRIAGHAGLALADVPIGGWESVQKRLVDIVLGTILIILLAPVMLGVSLVILATMGRPVLFRQKRYGFNNDEFLMLKFRSMVNDGAEGTGGSEAESAMLRQATRGDPRVTGFGRFLRRTSLDELPQLLNVVRGTMSLVGPRPHAVSHNEYYAVAIDGYLGRHRVKPGITGWAQVNGLRGETDTIDKMRLRLELDLFYIENWSLGFDLKILALTVIEVFNGRSAY